MAQYAALSYYNFLKQSPTTNPLVRVSLNLMNPEARAIDAKPGQAHDQNKSRRHKQTFRIHDFKI